MMMRLIASICLLAFVASPSSDRFRNYHAVEAYEIRPGIMIAPAYTAKHDLCEISIERRHYSNNSVDMDAAMSKEQVLSLFDELVPREERGGPAHGLPAGTEISEADLGILQTRIPYEYVTLTMHGKKDRPDQQKYISGVVSWNQKPCTVK